MTSGSETCFKCKTWFPDGAHLRIMERALFDPLSKDPSKPRKRICEKCWSMEGCSKPEISLKKGLSMKKEDEYLEERNHVHEEKTFYRVYSPEGWYDYVDQKSYSSAMAALLEALSDARMTIKNAVDFDKWRETLVFEMTEVVFNKHQKKDI